jgi:hypothetical protein
LRCSDKDLSEGLKEDYKTAALPIELRQQDGKTIFNVCFAQYQSALGPVKKVPSVKPLFCT